MRAEPDLPDLGERGDPAQVADAAGVGDRRADEVDQLLGDELLELPDRVEDLADRQRHGGVPADVPQHLLVLRGGDVLEPEQVQRFQRLAQPGGLVRVEPVVHVVQQRHLGSDVFAGRGQRDGRVPQVGVGVPDLLGRRGAPPGGLVGRARPAHPVHGVQPGHAGLGADGLEAALASGVDRVEQRGDVPPGGVGVAEDPVPDGPAEQLVDRLAGGLALDVPEREVDGADRGHRHRARAASTRRGRGTARCPRCGPGRGRSAAGRRGRAGTRRPRARARSGWRRPSR